MPDLVIELGPTPARRRCSLAEFIVWRDVVTHVLLLPFGGRGAGVLRGLLALRPLALVKREYDPRVLVIVAVHALCKQRAMQRSIWMGQALMDSARAPRVPLHAYVPCRLRACVCCWCDNICTLFCAQTA